MAQTGSRFPQRKSGARREGAAVSGHSSTAAASTNELPKPVKPDQSHVARTTQSTAPPTPLYRHLLIGRGLGWFGAATLAVIFLQVFVQFRWHNNQPIPGVCAPYYPKETNYQNNDMLAWVSTGLMLPKSAVWYRAPRPLFPLIVTAANTVGIIPTPTNFHPNSLDPTLLNRAVQVFQIANALMAVAALWLFFAACLWLGLSPPGALLATILAGSGFGFSYFVVQAIPEVLSYFSVAVVLAGTAVVSEYHGEKVRSLLSSALAWGALGLVTGILLLGKELYFLVLFVGLLLLWKRMWAGLVAFGVMCVLPTTLWMHYITNIGKFFDPVIYYQEYQFMVWIWKELLPADAVNKLRLLGTNLQNQITTLLQAFVYVPVLLMIVGLTLQRVRSQGIVVGAFFLSLYGAMLASNFTMPRIMFMTWPFVFFFAWLGIDFLAQRAAEFLPEGARSKARWGLSVAAVLMLAWLQNQMLFAAYCYG
jgi:hypothetical protein